MPSLLSTLDELIAAATAAAATGATVGDGQPFDAQVRRSDHADFQANGLLALARRLGRPPRDLAAAVAAEATGREPLAACDIAGPGFLNLTVTDTALLGRAARLLTDPRLGVDRPEQGVRTVVDYSQPNVAKEMHVGHLRSTLIGDALARILGFLGGTVIRQSHVGDWGTQFGMLIEHVVHSSGPAGRADVGGLNELYRAARLRFDGEPGFADRSRRRVVQLQAGDPATVAHWRAMVAESTTYFSEIYARLGVLLTGADVVGESFYNGQLADVVAELVRLGVAEPSDDALCVFFPDIQSPTGEPVPLIVRKSDGGFGYPATDLAALRHRTGTLRADRILYVVDARQALHFRMVFAAARRAGWLPDRVDARHVAFGTVLGPDGRPFKTRSGQTVRLVDLLDQAVDRARAAVAEKCPTLDAATARTRADQVALAAVKYADLSTSRTRDYRFEPDRMVAFTGNTGVYLQFAHARIRSILRRAGAPGHIAPDASIVAAERRLILDLDGFGDAVVEAAQTLEPHRLCGYLYRLAQTYTTCYEQCPVLTAPEAVRDTRLALARLTGEVLRTGLGLLGIPAPDEL